ncbi:MAG: 6-carboxytetrahydropterin synthase QueD [Candidatus Omnitrophica bacterium]|nr:6-carboxytetrahydropterin synthase QueD [Candidatus Omnitrophota bacterium]
MFELSVKGHISSAHFLREYPGKCKKLHGHNWKVEMFIGADKLDELGMLVDFSVVKDKLTAFLSSLDHVCLNDLPYFKEHNPTTEHIARFIYREFAAQVAPVKIMRVQVWESEQNSVIYYE